MKAHDRHVFEDAIKLYGRIAQRDQAIEDAAGLIVELRNNAKENPNCLIEKIADVSIALDQLEIMFGEEDVSEARSDNIVRLKSKIKRAHESNKKELTRDE